ncbi:MAG: sulfur oxidation c-type cytochrome SoxA [Aquificaceae bacterium]
MKRFMIYGLILLGTGYAQEEDPVKHVQEQRRMLREAFGLLLEQYIEEGRELFKKYGLDRCDFGAGPGVVKGVAARMPRYFPDADRVMSLETRIYYCIAKNTGKSLQQVSSEMTKNWQGPGSRPPSDMDKISFYIVSESRGEKIDPPLKHPKEREALKVAEAVFYRRWGALDFSCAVCHAGDGKRIRLQQTSNYSEPYPKAKQQEFNIYPIFRAASEATQYAHHRWADCFWQMRLPTLIPGSLLSDALTLYVYHMIRGKTMEGPSVSR